MASLPQQSPGPQRQQSSQHSDSSSAPEGGASLKNHRRSSIPQSATSEDSQTVLLNHPSSSNTSSPTPDEKQKQVTSRPNAHSSASENEPRKCWICFSDETEDEPTSSEWRSPCPCALKAHESCLLDWVADLEAPNKKHSPTPKVECPQCKAEITVSRPRSMVVDGVHAVERATGRMVLPFVVVTLAGTVITGCWMHGFSTVYLFLGPEDADRLLGLDSGMGFTGNWGLSLPLIPISLIASRTTYADNILPILPIFYFASKAPQRETSLWPPSAAMTLATLPYIRAAYNGIYKRIFTPLEKTWTREVQPRAGEDGNDANELDNEPVNHEDQDGMNIELGIQVEIIEDDGEEEEVEAGGPPQEQPREGEAAIQDEINQGQEADPNHDHPHHPQPHPQPHMNAAPQPGAQNLILSANSIVQTVIGALIFPTISTAMGALLKGALPRTWTTPPGRWDRYPVGFLQSRFGRSVVGGCFFVVLKDTLLLYSKYRLAQDHKKRRIVDWDPRKEARRRA